MTTNSRDLLFLRIDVIEYLDDQEMVLFRFSSDLPADEEIEIVIEYNGSIQEEMAGFYRRYNIENQS